MFYRAVCAEQAAKPGAGQFHHPLSLPNWSFPLGSNTPLYIYNIKYFNPCKHSNVYNARTHTHIRTHIHTETHKLEVLCLSVLIFKFTKKKKKKNFLKELERLPEIKSILKKSGS